MPFDSKFLKTLEALNILCRKVLAGRDGGERRSSRKGASIEFADYRRYVPGDEVRYIDWNVYARQGGLFIKEFAAEENIHVVVLIDTSRSMEFGGKFEAARQLAAALGYIGLANADTVSLYSFGAGLSPIHRFLRGKARIFDLLSALEALEPSGATDLRAAFRGTIPRLRGRSVILLLTDFYDLEGYAEGIRCLMAQRFEVHLIHLVAQEEVAPEARGRINLLDLETGRIKDVTILPRTVEAYRRRFGRFCDDLEEFGRAHELAYARLLADVPLERKVVDVLRAGGVIAHR